jgi:hypothetical protein
VLAREPRASVAADEHSLNRRCRASQLEDGRNGRACRNLNDPRSFDAPTYGDEARARGFWRPNTSKPVSAVSRDESNIRQGLDIMDKCRIAPNCQGHGLVQSEPRDSNMPGDARHKRRLFSGDVASGKSLHFNRRRWRALRGALGEHAYE